MYVLLIILFGSAINIQVTNFFHVCLLAPIHVQYGGSQVLLFKQVFGHVYEFWQLLGG